MRNLRLVIMLYTPLLFSGLMLGCTAGRNAATTPPPDKFAFVEILTFYSGEVLEGEAPPTRRIDMPGYHYYTNPVRIELYRNKESVRVDSLKLLLGMGKVLSGAAGSGVSSFFVPIYRIPCSVEKTDILEVNAKIIRIRIAGKVISVASGEQWERTDSRTDTLTFEGNRVIIRNRVSTRINYRGFIPKAAIN